MKAKPEEIEAAREAGAVAAEAHQKARGHRKADVQDALCDLLHYAAEMGEDPAKLAAAALENFRNEIGEAA